MSLHKWLLTAVFFFLPIGCLFAENGGYPHLLDSKENALNYVPTGSTSGHSDQAEWDNAGYYTTVRFKNGVVGAIEITPTNSKDHKGPDINLILQFAPQNISGVTLGNTDSTSVVDSRWQDWEIGDKVVRLIVDTYKTDNPSLDHKKGDLSSMRWMVRDKNSSTWW